MASSPLAATPTQLILNDDAPTFWGIKRALLARIGAEWKIGDRLPPISELARSMAVGQNNAHRAVRELVAEGVLFSRRGLGLFVRQLPQAQAEENTDAGPLHGKTIGLAIASPSPLPFVQQMMEGFREVIGASGADTRVLAGVNDPLSSKDAAGLWATVLFNPRSDLAAPPDKVNAALVMTSDHIHPEFVARFDSVSVDQFHGGSLAGRTLRAAGCHRVCFLGRRIAINTHRFDATSSARLHGFERTWGAHLEGADLLYAPGYSIDAGALRCTDYLKMSPRPDGIFAASDDLAVGFIAAALSHGLKAGRDYQLVGFDGQDRDLSAVSGLKLTTVQVPAREMGRRAAQLMIQRALEPARPVQRVLLSCALAHGDTART